MASRQTKKTSDLNDRRSTGSTLTPKILLFIDAFLKCANATQAAKDAGYSVKTARNIGCNLLLREDVQAELGRRRVVVEDIANLDAAKVIREVASILFSDVRKLFDEHGKLLPIQSLDSATAAAIAAIEVDTLFEGSGKDREAIGTTTKIKLWDKNSAADKLMKHLGLFEKHNEQQVNPLTEFLAKISAQNAKLPIKDTNK
jgi:phage terminase small subunit